MIELVQLENIEVCPDDLILFRVSDNLGNLELLTRNPGAIILTLLSFFSLPYSEVLYTLIILVFYCFKEISFPQPV